jgi:hypothetical protein
MVPLHHKKLYYLCAPEARQMILLKISILFLNPGAEECLRENNNSANQWGKSNFLPRSIGL